MLVQYLYLPCNWKLTYHTITFAARTTLKTGQEYFFHFMYDCTQLIYIDLGKEVLTIKESFRLLHIAIYWCIKPKNYVALDCALGDRGPMDPRGVPWDQNFWSKIFLISSSNDLILWVLWIGYAKNAKNQEKLLILGHILLFPLLLRKYAKISSFWSITAFLA